MHVSVAFIMREMNKIYLVFLFVLLSACTTISYYHLVPPYNSNPELVSEIKFKLKTLLENEEFNAVDKIDPRFYGMTGFRTEDNLTLELKYKQVSVIKMWPFPDEYDVVFVYLVNWKDALTIVSFKPSRGGDKLLTKINEKIKKEFRPYVDRKEIQIKTGPYIYLN